MEILGALLSGTRPNTGTSVDLPDPGLVSLISSILEFFDGIC
jgi:hypothetical protein